MKVDNIFENIKAMKRFFQALTFTLFLHSFAGWFYIAENAVFHPETLAWGLTHFGPWPREDTFGIVCFGVSLVSLFTFMMIRNCAAPISELKVAPKESIPKASDTSAGIKELKVSANKAKAKPRPLKKNAKKVVARKRVKKIKVIDLSEK